MNKGFVLSEENKIMEDASFSPKIMKLMTLALAVVRECRAYPTLAATRPIATMDAP